MKHYLITAEHSHEVVLTFKVETELLSKLTAKIERRINSAAPAECPIKFIYSFSTETCKGWKWSRETTGEYTVIRLSRETDSVSLIRTKSE